MNRPVGSDAEPNAGFACVRRDLHASATASSRRQRFGRLRWLAWHQARRIRTFALVCLVELLLRTCSIARAARMLRVPVQTDDSSAKPEASGADLDEWVWTDVRMVGKAVQMIRPKDGCLRSSLATGVLLRRLKPAVRIGLQRDSSDATQLLAHSWVEVGNWSIGSRDDFLSFQAPRMVG